MTEIKIKFKHEGLQLIPLQALANPTVQGVCRESLQLLPLVELLHSDDFDLLDATDDEDDNFEDESHHNNDENTNHLNK